MQVRGQSSGLEFRHEVDCDACFTKIFDAFAVFEIWWLGYGDVNGFNAACDDDVGAWYGVAITGGAWLHRAIERGAYEA